MSPIVFAVVCYLSFTLPTALILWLDGDTASSASAARPAPEAKEAR